MYTSFFGLNEKPFSITPNPRYLYMSERHTEALAHLIYGIKDASGFVQLTGEVGTGKTTLIRSLLQRLPENADVALILNPQLSATEFLTSILTEFRVEVPAQADSKKALIDALNNFLLENHSRGRRSILIVDEAQNFAVDVLEQIRLLTNLETAKQKLFQITLIGQPELRTMLARTDLRQLAQRITGRYHLEPLDEADTERYVQHRMRVAGATREIFNKRACRELYRLSGGIPRIINVIADRALLGAYTIEAPEIGARMIRNAAAEIYDLDSDKDSRRRRWLMIAGLVTAMVIVLSASVYIARRYADARVAQAVSSAPTAAPSVAVTDTAVKAAPTADRPTVATATAAPMTPVSLENFLLEHPDETDAPTAFRNLFKLWNTPYDENSERACEYAATKGLFCLLEQGSLEQLQILNHAAILTLTDSKGGIHQVVLAAIQGTEATIEVGPDALSVPVADLTALWSGEYLLLWKPQIGTLKSFSRGMQDKDVVWLRNSLASIQGIPVEPVTSEYFDDVLEARIREYQASRNLTVDGLVGQQTQIVMNSDLASDEPRLKGSN